MLSFVRELNANRPELRTLIQSVADSRQSRWIERTVDRRRLNWLLVPLSLKQPKLFHTTVSSTDHGWGQRSNKKL